MKIWCTVLRENGSYKSTAVKAGENSFTMDKDTYDLKKGKFYQGRVLGIIPILRAIYVEGNPTPLEFSIADQMIKQKFKIDTRAIKNLTNKKILDVFNEDELSKLEKILIMGLIGVGALAGLSMYFSYQIYDAISKVL